MIIVNVVIAVTIIAAINVVVVGYINTINSINIMSNQSGITVRRRYVWIGLYICICLI